MNYYFIANPHARNGAGGRQVASLRAEVTRQGLAHEWVTCESLDHARVLARRANLAGYDVVVAVGGDGTINRVLNGFFDADGRRLSPARLGVVHVGTSPDFCRSHGVPLGIRPAVATLRSGTTRAISVGKVTCKGLQPVSQRECRREPGRELAVAVGREQPRFAPSQLSATADWTGPDWSPFPREIPAAFFGCCANIGLGASLARLANGGIRRCLGDVGGTFVSLLRVLLTYRPQTLEVVLDGRPRRFDRVYNISVGKTARIASGIKVRHDLQPQDDRFYVVCACNLTWLKVPRILCALYRGGPIVSDASLCLDYARSVSLVSADAVEVEFDGDPAGRCPCQIETAPDPLHLLVPA